ncbi:MAG: hypothetical protein IKW74_00930 [Thermoguttaceae bacterium]|nr:hypothetical protein [Thermoguttaceae bacterium]
MKRFVIMSVMVLTVVSFAVGCRSMGNCFTRNGSKVPTASYAPVSAQEAPAEDVVYVAPTAMMGSGNCAPCTAACNPCTPNACDPCNNGATTNASYPPTTYPGM